IGAERYYTAALIACTMFPNSTTIGLASGTTFADALAGSAHVGKLGGAILLIDPTSAALPSSTSSFVTGDRDSSIRGYVYGGTSAVSASLYQAAVTALN